MTRCRYPRHVHGFVDHQGKPRFYFRRKGQPAIPLPGLPWSPVFMGKYQEAMAIELASQPKTERAVPRSIRALANAYYDSAAFVSLKSITRGVYRNIIERLCRDKGQDGQAIGDKSAVTMKANSVETLMQRRADKPDSANGLRKVLRAMMQHAIKLQWRTDDPTQGVKKIRPKKKGGFHRWSDAEVATFENAHQIGTRGRLAMALGLYTGQARQDVVAMGEQHITDEVLDWVRMKTETSTGLELAIPVHPELRRIIDATPSKHLTFLVTEKGAPFTAAGFGNWFRDRCNEAGLPHCSFHGLRKAASSRLADVGCDAMEIAAITGHASLREVQRYTETRDRKRAARRAMDKLISGTEFANRPIPFARKGKKA